MLRTGFSTFGMRSFLSSHNFWYVFPHAAMEFVLSQRDGSSSTMDVDPEVAPEVPDLANQEPADELFDCLGVRNTRVLPAADEEMDVAYRQYGSLVTIVKKHDPKEYEGAGRPAKKTFRVFSCISSSKMHVLRPQCGGGVAAVWECVCGGGGVG